VHLVSFIIKKFVTMHINLKYVTSPSLYVCFHGVNIGKFAFIRLKYRTNSFRPANNPRTAGNTEYVASMGYDFHLLSVQNDVVVKG